MKTLIAIQLIDQTIPSGKKYLRPTYHKMEPDDVKKYCQFLANATTYEVRVTYPHNITDDVERYNGTYFSPKNGNLGYKPKTDFKA